MAGLRETLEREVKLSPGKRFEMPELGGEALISRVFVSTYHDTPELRLARSGLTLRHRVENGRGVWQLKLPSGDSRRSSASVSRRARSASSSASQVSSCSASPITRLCTSAFWRMSSAAMQKPNVRTRRSSRRTPNSPA